MVYRTVIVFVVLLQLTIVWPILGIIGSLPNNVYDGGENVFLKSEFTYICNAVSKFIAFIPCQSILPMLVNFSGSDLQDCKKLVPSSPQNVKLGSFTSCSCKKSETCPKNLSLFCLSRCRRLRRRGLRSVFKIIVTTLRLTTSPVS